MTKPYKPSDAIIEQLARETCNALWEQHFINKDYDSLPDENKAEIKKYQVLTYVVNLPTINKALELYENQPQWQDKPDKVGWWCVMVKGRLCGWDWLYPPANTVYVSKQKGTIHIEAESYDFTLSEFLKRYTYGGIKFLYLPKLEPYKERE